MIDLQKDLEKIFTRHAPEKIPMIPSILERAKGKEEQVLAGIMERLGISEVPVLRDIPIIENAKKTQLIKRKWWLLILIPILMVFGMVGAWFLMDISVGADPEEMYVIASALYVRSEPCVNEAISLDKLPFGSKVLVTRTLDSCSSGGLWVAIDFKGTEQYLALKYLGDKKEFEEINALFANPEARDLSLQTRDKHALLDYFASHQMMGNMNPILQQELYGQVKSNEVWQIFGEPSGSFYDATDFGYFHEDQSFGKDVAVILSKIDTSTGNPSSERRLLIFKFDKSDTGFMYSALDMGEYPGYGLKTVENALYLTRFPAYVRSKVSEENPGILLGNNKDVYARKYLLLNVEGEFQVFNERKRLGFWGL